MFVSFYSTGALLTGSLGSTSIATFGWGKKGFTSRWGWKERKKKRKWYEVVWAQGGRRAMSGFAMGYEGSGVFQVVEN